MEQFTNKELAEKKAYEVLFNLKDEISLSSRLLYIALLSSERDRIIKHDELADITGLSIPTVKNSIRELVDKKLLITTRASHGAFYTVLNGDGTV